MNEQLGIAGSGAIARGLAEVAAERGVVAMLARSPESGDRARAAMEGHDVEVHHELNALAGCTFVVEAIAEDQDAKAALLAEIGALLAPAAILATTTSSLSVAALAQASGRPERFVGLHVFNPVAKMALVELAFADTATTETRARTAALCEALGKTAVEVPDTPGFVVNRLLFPFLFDAVRMLERSGLEPEAIDSCMKLGAGHPLGPLALLDLVGLDVAAAIGEAIGAEVPARVRELIGDGALGRKAGRGFYDY